ncbi:thioredoxin domain-containing protein [Candidatus Nitronereus thalassa]|uniref:DUF255 domain-containing protein n=1 Tax=Candidatus Nitronereus thalassa TaxID=3020898 RepID=A0ABU3KCM4_9BACT|nr:DUF255 domain-containing protein [Candidatus Nitronereus thalassa]MDT7044182.1 DUF255 domain-containing protein [Candidatus Nitronereus thalassa]
MSDSPGKPSHIQWVEWDIQAFERAKTEDKLILLDLTAMWCHACHVMDETTYVNPEIVELLNSSFIPVRVETDQRPDIEARYKHGGWPTTSILLPSGEILFQANALTPEELLLALQETQSLYRKHKEDLFARAEKVWEQVEAATQARVPPDGAIPRDLPKHMLVTMKQSFDQANGGFRDAPKFFEPDAMTFLFEIHYWQQDPVVRQMALFTLDQQLKLYDPVWGGFYRYAERPDWTAPHYEKMLPIQAHNVLNYLEAYQITKSQKYRDVVEGTIRYVTRFLSDSERGGFFASQDADVRNISGSESFIPGKRYFSLNESERLMVGFPTIDHSIYTGWNGLMAKSFLVTSQVFGDERLREYALLTLDRLFEERYQPGKGMAHVIHEGHLKQFGLLEDQLWFTAALAEAYVTTGLSTYLDRAEQIVQDMIPLLEDKQGGGFFDRPRNVGSQGLLKFPYKDIKTNASLALVLSELSYLTGEVAYRDLAKRVLQFVVGGNNPLPVASLGLATQRFYQYPVHIVVVGEEQDVSTENLFKRALALYVPGKVVRHLDPQKDSLSVGEVTFPMSEVAQAFVCTDKLCSSPIQQAEALGKHLDELMAGLFQSQEPFPYAR